MEASMHAPTNNSATTRTTHNETLHSIAEFEPIETTFGIELEFIVVYKTPTLIETAPILPEEPTTEHWGAMPVIASSTGPDIRHVLHEHVYQAICDMSERQDRANVRVHRPGPYRSYHYHQWHIMPDCSLGTRDDEARCLQRMRQEQSQGVEVVSRVFHTGRDDWEKELRTVLDGILSLNGPNMQVLVNDSCGLHVHVGNGTAGIPLRTQQKLALLVSAFERQIDCLHSATRFDGAATIFGEAYNLGPAELWQKGGMGVRRGLRWLGDLEIKTTDFIADIMGGKQAKNSTYNFTDRVFSNEEMDQGARDGQAIRTVEFRQHRGTLIFKEIQAWILTATQMVRYAHETPREQIDNLIEAKFDDIGYTQHRLLAQFGVTRAARYFYWRKCERRPEAEEAIRQKQPEHPKFRIRCPNGNKLMDVVNEKYATNNSWEVVSAAVAKRLERGHYGVGQTEEDEVWHEGYSKVEITAPVWLKGFSSSKSKVAPVWLKGFSKLLVKDKAKDKVHKEVES